MAAAKPAGPPPTINTSNGILSRSDWIIVDDIIRVWRILVVVVVVDSFLLLLLLLLLLMLLIGDERVRTDESRCRAITVEKEDRMEDNMMDPPRLVLLASCLLAGGSCSPAGGYCC
jgi:hypothetical protein